VIALPLAWAALVLAGAWRVRPLPARVDRAPRPTRSLSSPAPVVAALTALVVPLVLLAPIALGAWAVPVLRARRAQQRRAQEVVRSLPETVDLLRLAIGAGLTVSLAVDAVVRRGDGPIARELGRALDEVTLGQRLADALDDVVARTSEDVRPLIAALVASDRYGAPLGDALARLAGEVRAERRRRAEEAARTVPVKLLFPLVSCVLPAFGLLTLAPLIAGAVAALRL
jgi:tight adherence protein C